MKENTLTEAELAALVALVNRETEQLAEQRVTFGEHRWDPNTEAVQRLWAELARRGVLQ